MAYCDDSLLKKTSKHVVIHEGHQLHFLKQVHQDSRTLVVVLANFFGPFTLNTVWWWDSLLILSVMGSAELRQLIFFFFF